MERGPIQPQHPGQRGGDKGLPAGNGGQDGELRSGDAGGRQGLIIESCHHTAGEAQVMA